MNDNNEDDRYDQDIISVPDHMTVTEAIAHCLKTATDNDTAFFETEICGSYFCMGFIELDEYMDAPEKFTEGRKRDAFLCEYAERLGYQLPLYAYSDEGFLKNYPFKNDALETLFTTPHAQMTVDSVTAVLTGVQKDYIDHLFDTLQKSSDAQDRDTFKRCLAKINNDVIEHITNSCAYLTPERRHMLEQLAAREGVLTSYMQQQFRTAGIGPSIWDIVEHDTLLRAAKNSGKLVVPEFSKRH